MLLQQMVCENPKHSQDSLTQDKDNLKLTSQVHSTLKNLTISKIIVFRNPIKINGILSLSQMEQLLLHASPGKAGWEPVQQDNAGESPATHRPAFQSFSSSQSVTSDFLFLGTHMTFKYILHLHMFKVLIPNIWKSTSLSNFEFTGENC